MSSARKRASREKAINAAMRHANEIGALKAQVSMWKQVAEFLDAQLKAATTWRPLTEPPAISQEPGEFPESAPVLGLLIGGDRLIVKLSQFDEDDPPSWRTHCADWRDVTSRMRAWMPLPDAPNEQPGERNARTD